MPESHARGMLLRGIDGANLLGFMASIGTLRTLALRDAASDWRLSWSIHEGLWAPRLSSSEGLSEGKLVEILHAALKHEDPPVSRFPFDNLSVTPDDFRKVAIDAQRHASPHDRCLADFVVSFGSEALSTRDGKKIQDTHLRAIGAGRQRFLGTMKKLYDEENTAAEALRSSLFESWDYGDRGLGLRWDPEEDRRYALRWSNPSDNKGVPTMRGANRLAVEALPLLPTAASAHHLQTTGVTHRDGAVFLTWPIWEAPSSVDVVRSVLALSELQRPEPDRTRLGARGIVEVYRCRRITTGRYRNFTHAVPA